MSKGEHRKGRPYPSRDGYGRGSKPAHKAGNGCAVVILAAAGGLAAAGFAVAETIKGVF